MATMFEVSHLLTIQFGRGAHNGGSPTFQRAGSSMVAAISVNDGSFNSCRFRIHSAHRDDRHPSQRRCKEHQEGKLILFTEEESC